MAEAFPRTISLLRKERGLSQKSAAEALHVSQALLSHYENGAREPSYDFLIRAATFYRVSTDYLLGLTMSRERSEDILRDGGTAHAATHSVHKQRLLQNSVALLYDLLQGIGSDGFTERVERYLILAVYRLFRYLYTTYPGANDALFSIPFATFSELTDIEMKRAEVEIKLRSAELSDAGGLPEGMSYDQLREKYPEHSRYTMPLLYDAGEYLIPESEKYGKKS